MTPQEHARQLYNSPLRKYCTPMYLMRGGELQLVCDCIKLMDGSWWVIEFDHGNIKAVKRLGGRDVILPT